VDTSAFAYELPPERIAQRPLEPRDAARLLVDLGADSPPAHRTVADLPSLLEPGDVVVVNDTRVLQARLRLRRATGGPAEVLLLEPDSDGWWSALVRPGRRLMPGTFLYAADNPAAPRDHQGGEADAEPNPCDPTEPLPRPTTSAAPPGPGVTAAGPSVAAAGPGVAGPGPDVARPGRPARARRPGPTDRAPGPVVEIGGSVSTGGDGVRRVRILGDAAELMATVGEVPLPPYITSLLDDAERYQTVYADRPASVAAPTAGLHLTDTVLSQIRDRGATVANVELVVGLGTFRPITADAVDEHVMHAENYRVPAETMDACRDARRVIAIGTTTVRALESAAATSALTGRTDLFIRRPYPFSVVDVLLTNFHLPRSSLLVMIDAFIGPRWRDLYDLALAERYRFLSFGDAMLLTRTEATP
jgi:S-adenosylmethionine:tRNA ribosyltransferase-isomerase